MTLGDRLHDREAQPVPGVASPARRWKRSNTRSRSAAGSRGRRRPPSSSTCLGLPHRRRSPTLPAGRIAQRVVDQVLDQRAQLRFDARNAGPAPGASAPRSTCCALRRAGVAAHHVAPSAREIHRGSACSGTPGVEAREVEELLHQRGARARCRRRARRARRRAPAASARARASCACSASADTGERSSCAASARKRRCASSDGRAARAAR